MCPWLPRSSWDRRRSSRQSDQEPVLPGLEETEELRSGWWGVGQGRQFIPHIPSRVAGPWRGIGGGCTGEQLWPASTGRAPRGQAGGPAPPAASWASAKSWCVSGGGQGGGAPHREGTRGPFRRRAETPRQRAEGHSSAHLLSEKVSVCTTRALPQTPASLIPEARGTLRAQHCLTQALPGHQPLPGDPHVSTVTAREGPHPGGTEPPAQHHHPPCWPGRGEPGAGYPGAQPCLEGPAKATSTWGLPSSSLVRWALGYAAAPCSGEDTASLPGSGRC